MTQLIRVDKHHVLCLYYRNALALIHMPTMNVVGMYEYPPYQADPEGYSENVIIHDCIMLGA